jgi:hypothetical protein
MNTRTRRTLRVLAVVAAAGAALTACGVRPDPCAQLGTPTAANVQSVREDPEVEVEKELGDVECVVVILGDGRAAWQQDRDS